MLLDLVIMAALLLFGNMKFRHFDPKLSIARRILKTLIALSITAVISHYFGHKGFFIALGIISIPLIYVHGIWLPRHGVNGWTGEPREKYYALRGWSLRD